MNELTIRAMEIGDVDQVIEVDKASFSTSWTPDIFYQEISENKYAHYYIVEIAGHIIGYAGAWIVYEDAQITNIAIKPEYRGKKIGQKLFQFMLQLAKVAGAERLSLEVRATNVIAQRMYRKFGLVPGGIRKNYYTDNNEDAIVMWVSFI
jgi:ribosomal-protein-alanine N-acetyltransferase